MNFHSKLRDICHLIILNRESIKFYIKSFHRDLGFKLFIYILTFEAIIYSYPQLRCESKYESFILHQYHITHM